MIRDGKVVKYGVGLCGFRGFFDQVVRYPSNIKYVNFSSQQVTKEMQGLEVSGMIVWSI